LWTETELTMARFQLAHGKKNEARASLETLTQLWSHADNNYVPSREVRRLLSEPPR